MIRGYAGRVLDVDLAARTFEFGPLDQDTARLYLGGKGYGTRLLYDMTPAGIDPLGPANPLIFATGPLNGSIAPQSNRFAVVCKSPLTGAIGNAACGGSFAYGLKRAGVDVLIVRNQSPSPVRLEIDGDRSMSRSSTRRTCGARVRARRRRSWAARSTTRSSAPRASTWCSSRASCRTSASRRAPASAP